MTIEIDAWEFDYVDYDREADVLYLATGQPRAGYGEETPEGHILRYDEDGEFYGVTLVGVREIIDKLGSVKVTGLPRRFIPHEAEIDARDLEPALA